MEQKSTATVIPYAFWCMDERCGNGNFCHICPTCTIHIKESHKKGRNYSKHVQKEHLELIKVFS